MKNFILILAGLAMSGVALAAPPTYLEFAYISGGENNDRSGSNDDKDGIEFTGSWGFNENWYAGGIIGRYDDGTADYDYINANGGYAHSLNEKSNLSLEGGLWFGEKDPDSGAPKSDPTAIEAKAGIDTMISDKFSVFGTLSLVWGDLDVDTNDDLSNFIWSLGGSYSFTDTISMSVKLVDGKNGVNGQDEVLRIGGRWTF
jgi:hypothetical protein